MATLLTGGDGSPRLQFSVSGSRKSLRLGGMGPDAAGLARHHVEVALRAHRRRQPIPVQTLDWLFQTAPRKLLSALAEMGVVDDRRQLGDALQSWIMTECLELSEKRVALVERMAERLARFLGDIELEAITPTRLEQWQTRLAGEFSANTVSSYLGCAKQFFAWACGQRLLIESPAHGLVVRYCESARLHEVPADDVSALCNAADPELRLALLLARWGGLRAGEILRVENTDISPDTVLVRDTKRRHTGQGLRRVPLFPMLAELPDAADGSQRAGNDLLLPHLSQCSPAAMDQRAKRLCAQLQIPVWPRFWQNMRATRESELMEEFSLKDVCKWIGNSPAVAMKHYALVRRKEFDRAVGWRCC